MNKNNIIFILTFSFFFIFFGFNFIQALELISPNQEITKVLNLLEKLPEYRELIKGVEREGAIKIEMVLMDKETFDAFWDSPNRKIRINFAKNRDINVLLCSVLFEIHNAKSDKEFKILYGMAKKGQISKEKYVEKVERMEHRNALCCSKLIEKGIEKGLFSTKAAWGIYPDFDDHYMVQQVARHSHFLAENYEQMAPKAVGYRNYKGTLPPLSAEGKKDVLRYLKIKNDLESDSEERHSRGYDNLKREYVELQNGNSERGDEKFQLLDLIFEKNADYLALLNSETN